MKKVLFSIFSFVSLILSAQCLDSLVSIDVIPSSNSGDFEFEMVLSGSPDSLATYAWSVNGVSVNASSDSYFQNFSPGSHEICGYYFVPGCQDGEVCITLTLEDDSINIGNLSFGSWYTLSYDSTYLDSLLLDELLSWDSLYLWPDSVVISIFGGVIPFDTTLLGATDNFVIDFDGSINQQEIDDLLVNGVVVITGEELADLWIDFLNSFSGSLATTTLQDLLDLFASSLQARSSQFLNIGELDLDIYYNTVNNEVELGGTEFSSVKIYNMQGQVVKSSSLRGVESIQLQNLEKGIYILHFIQNQKSHYIKVIR